MIPLPIKISITGMLVTFICAILSDAKAYKTSLIFGGIVASSGLAGIASALGGIFWWIWS